jgi:hypothetical protein
MYGSRSWRNARAFASAQRAYDNMTPEDVYGYADEDAEDEELEEEEEELTEEEEALIDAEVREEMRQAEKREEEPKER